MLPAAVSAGEATAACFAAGPCAAVVVATAELARNLLSDSPLIEENKENGGSDNNSPTQVNNDSTSAGGAAGLPPDDDNDDKRQSNASKNKDNQQQSNDFVNYKGKLEKEDRIDLSRFSKRNQISGKKAEFTDPKTGWRISEERSKTNPHGGSAWKLYNKSGNRVGTLDKNGVYKNK